MLLFLEVQRVNEDCTSHRPSLQRLSQPNLIAEGQRAPGLRLADGRVIGRHRTTEAERLIKRDLVEFAAFGLEHARHIRAVFDSFQLNRPSPSFIGSSNI